MDYAYLHDKDMEERLGISVLNVNRVETGDRRVLNRYKGIVVLQGGEDHVNRFAVEQKGVILVHPEYHFREDSFHCRHSGLNSVLCTLARKHNVSIGFSFSLVLNSCGIERSRLLGRMRQNVRLCRKYKVSMRLGSFASSSWELRNDDCLNSFGRVIGMTAGEANHALS